MQYNKFMDIIRKRAKQAQVGDETFNRLDEINETLKSFSEDLDRMLRGTIYFSSEGLDEIADALAALSGEIREVSSRVL